MIFGSRRVEPEDWGDKLTTCFGSACSLPSWLRGTNTAWTSISKLDPGKNNPSTDPATSRTEFLIIEMCFLGVYKLDLCIFSCCEQSERFDMMSIVSLGSTDTWIYWLIWCVRRGNGSHCSTALTVMTHSDVHPLHLWTNTEDRVKHRVENIFLAEQTVIILYI